MEDIFHVVFKFPWDCMLVVVLPQYNYRVLELRPKVA